MNPTYNTDLDSGDSPNDMLVDSEDLVNDVENEKDEGVHDIHTDEEKTRADDVEAIKELVFLPLQEEPPILEDVVHTWEIKDWNSHPRRTRGPIFYCGGHPWRVLMFPKGNNVDYASFYLEHGYGDETTELPENFSCCIQFGLVLWNPDHPTVFQHHTAHHRFTKEEGDWGFTRFVELRKLWNVPWDNTPYYIADGEKANMTAYVRHVKDETGVLWHNFMNYDSKTETGYVGLKNQGATCYLNSLLQSLYFTNAFRKAVYQIPTQDEETLQNSAYTLQRLFYQLQTSNNAVGTIELTKSFGWETRHIFEQQDVQELSRKLMERLEEKMKGTEAENVLPKLFCGKVRTYIDCINVNYASRRLEDFWDIQLNVGVATGNKNLDDSFKDYIQVEIMNGENQYFAGEQFKLQDAKKGVIFESLPEVLHLQLKRFQYDFERDAMMKVNDRFEYPEVFDAAPYLASNADMSEPWTYQLHGVLVHSGDLNAGHYYAFIKPNKDGWFYKFDDDKVTKATMREVLEESFGGEYTGKDGLTALRNGNKKPLMRQNSAYMLVYIRQSRVDDVLLPVTQADTPPHLQRRLDEEAATREARRKEREEQHLYLDVRVITDETFQAHGGIDLGILHKDWVNYPGAALYYRYLRKATVRDLITKVAQESGKDPRSLRLWVLVNRQNKTTRPDAPIIDTDATLEETYQRLVGTKNGELRLWAEVAEEVDADGNAIWPNQLAAPTNGVAQQNNMIVLFFKYFDVAHQTLNGVGYTYISKEKKVEDLVPLIKRLMGWPETGPQLKLFEEIKPSMIEVMKGKQTLRAAELQDGDIVCFQLASDPDSKIVPDPMSIKYTSKSGMSPRSENTIKSDTTMKSEPSIKSEKTDITMYSDSSAKSDTSSRTTAAGKSEKLPITQVRSASDYIDDARYFYDFLLNKRDVKFYPHPHRCPNPEKYDPFTLTLSSKHTYDQLAARVGEYLEVPGTHIRFWTVNAATSNPKTAVKRGQSQTVHAILNPPYSTFSNNNQRPDSLYFEILEISLSELDTKKSIKVIYLSEGISKEDTYDLLVPKNGNVEDLTQALLKKSGIDDEATAGPIRWYEIHSNKIYKELSRDYQVLAITDYVQVIAERIPEDERAPDVDFVQCFHFQNEPGKAHGIPFKFRVIQNEKFSDTKKRLEKRTGLKGKNFEKIKFAVVRRGSFAKPMYLTDEQVLDDELKHDDDLLGLDHADRTRGVRNGVGDLFLR